MESKQEVTSNKTYDLRHLIINKKEMTYEETIQYLYDRLPVFHHIGGSAYKPGLDNTIRLMDALWNPYTQYKTIHDGQGR